MPAMTQYIPRSFLKSNLLRLPFALILVLIGGFPLHSQTTALLPWTPTQFFTTTGAPLAAGKVCTYAAGTSTGLATYTDQTGTVANAVPPNAIVLDSTGSANIWLSTDRAYKIVVLTAGSDTTCSTGSVIKTVDQVSSLVRYTGTAAPVSGTYQAGDFVWNTTPSTSPGSSSAVLGWLCTVGGTPGTWVTVPGTLGGHIEGPTVADQTFTVKSAFTPYQTANYIATETGASNAIAGALTDASGANVTLAAGLCVTVKLAHTLQAGANTFNLNAGGAVAIRSHFNVANNLGTAYAATGFWTGCYDGTEWVDASE